MAGREFGKLGASIWRSRRFNQLSSDGARLAFVYVISTDHGNSIGTFRLPASYMAADRSIPLAQSESEIADLVKADLVDYDADEEVIHIRNWFRFNTIKNEKHLIGAIRYIEALPEASQLRGFVAADVLLSAFTISLGWASPDAQDKIRLIAATGCRRLIVKHRAQAYFRALTTNIDATVFRDLCDHLSITISKQVSKGISISISIQRERERERERDRDADRDRDGETRSARPRARVGRKPKTAKPPAPASAPKRAAADTKAKAKRKTSNASAVLHSMADLVKRLAQDKTAMPSRILAPDRAQLATLISKHLITEAERDRYLERITTK